MLARKLALLGVGLLLLGLFASAPDAVAHGGAHGDEAEESESEELARVPNNGAVIRIVSPANGLVCPAGMEVEVCVELENFTLGQAGCHWHVSVDGEPWSMIIDDRLNEVLYGLEPGEHRIEVFLADGEHRDLEEGDAVVVAVQ
jgi:hypothetical protein